MTTNLSPEHLAASLDNLDAESWPATRTGLLNDLGSNAESFWAEINDFMALSKAGHADDAAEALDTIQSTLHTINAHIGRLLDI